MIAVHSFIDLESQLFKRDKRKKKGGVLPRERKKKAVHITGPYIIYMLDEADVIDDWTAIKKAVKQQQQQRRRPGKLCQSYSPLHTTRQYLCLRVNYANLIHLSTPLANISATR